MIMNFNISIASEFFFGDPGENPRPKVLKKRADGTLYTTGWETATGSALPCISANLRPVNGPTN